MFKVGTKLLLSDNNNYVVVSIAEFENTSFCFLMNLDNHMEQKIYEMKKQDDGVEIIPILDDSKFNRSKIIEALDESSKRYLESLGEDIEN